MSISISIGMSIDIEYSYRYRYNDRYSIAVTGLVCQERKNSKGTTHPMSEEKARCSSYGY